MNTHALPSPAPGRFLLVVSPISTLDTLFDLIARLALQGPLTVLDGGNVFQGYPLARKLGRQADDISVPLQRVLLARAFTCYQMSVALNSAAPAPNGEGRPQPTIVLDFLASFYDQGVRIADRRRLLECCIRQLQALSRHVPVAVWVCQRTSVPQEALGFLDRLQSAAGQVWVPQRPPALPVKRQLPLFTS